MELPVHLVCSPGYTPHRAEVWGPHLGTEALVRDNVFHTWKQVKTWYELYLTDILSESNYTVTAKEAMLNSAGDLSSFIPVPPSPAILGPTLPFPGARGPPPLLSWPLCCPDRPPPHHSGVLCRPPALMYPAPPPSGPPHPSTPLRTPQAGGSAGLRRGRCTGGRLSTFQSSPVSNAIATVVQ